MKLRTIVLALASLLTNLLAAAQDASLTLPFIRENYDSGNFAEVGSLLNRLKSEQSDVYDSLPFSMMRAKALERAGDVGGAMSAYEEAAEGSGLAQFALLPLARLAAIKDEQALAVRSYQRYLGLKDPPEFASVAREALEYCIRIKKPDALRQTAEIVRREPSFRRLGDLYAGKSHILRGDPTQARILFQELIRKEIKDDVTSLALSELDVLDGKDLTEAQQVSRALLAYKVWNFDLTRRYLQPYALKSMENAYHYARSLAFGGKTDEARKTFQAAIGMWPEDKMARMTMYQYANFCLRLGENERAAELYTRLRPGADSDILENATFNLVQALRAQNKIQEAVDVLRPYCVSKKRSQRERALFLRARVYFQGAKFREALNDIRQLASPKSTLNEREVLYWKGMILEKLDMQEDARSVFKSLAASEDFFALQAQDRFKSTPDILPVLPLRTQPETATLCKLPGSDQESAILARSAAGDLLTPFLYLHMYEEASRLLSSVTIESWQILQVAVTDRPRKLLSIAYLAALGRNYPVATYYSEIYLKTLPKGARLFDLPPDVLRALFPLPYREVVGKFATDRKIDPLLILSIMKQESKFKEFARSQAFARGLMQLIPSTATQIASELGVSDFSLDHLYRPEVNINFGTHYVQNMMGKFGTRPEVIAASYNSGESNVRRWLACTSTDDVMEFYSNIDLSETKNYVHIVKTNYERYRRIYGADLAMK